jgi:hypothetical protein
VINTTLHLPPRVQPETLESSHLVYSTNNIARPDPRCPDPPLPFRLSIVTRTERLFNLRTGSLPYPIIADTDRDLATKLGMIDPDEKDVTGAPMTCRAVFIISPAKKVKLSLLYVAGVCLQLSSFTACTMSMDEPRSICASHDFMVRYGET